ncbi:MAG: hypothetical protein J6Y88_03700 [Bacteroidales bacterium]|nr:hypothetical protein [Bacteroidales bacterium]
MMNDKDLRELFHAYRPQLSDDEVFLNNLDWLMDKADAQHKVWRRHSVMTWVSGIAATLIIGLLGWWQMNKNEVRPESAQPLPAYYAERFPQPEGDIFDSYYQIVEEIEQSGQQLQQAIAQL